MSHWMKLALPIGLGVLAGFMHYQVLISKLTPHSFCVVNRELEPGDTLDDGDFTRIDLCGDFETLSKTAIPWKDRSLAVGRQVTCRLYKNDIVLYQYTSKWELDLRPDEAGFRVDLEKTGVDTTDIIVGASLMFTVIDSDESHDSTSNVAGGIPMRQDPETRAWKPVREPDDPTKTLGPVRVLAVGADTTHDGSLFSDEKFDRSNVKLGLPCDPRTRQPVPWAAQLLATLKGERKHANVLGVEVCDPRDFEVRSPSSSDLAENR